MNLAVITGGSRGLGYSISKQMLQKNFKVIQISRSKSDLDVEHVSADLSQIKDYDHFFKEIDFSQFENVFLVNNAAVITPIVPVEKLTSDKVMESLTVNLYAPFMLTTSFLNAAKKVTGQRIVINISSGVALRPKAHWAVYSATKAALEAFGVALSDESTDGFVRVINFDPGVMDTQMQKEIRETSSSDFPGVERFQDLKKNNHLQSTDQVAARVIEVLESEVDPTQIRYSV